MTQPPYIPPHNTESEIALLGAVLENNALFEKYCERLRGRHFYEPVHGQIFDVIQALVSNKRLASPATLRNHFAANEALADIGGAEYLLTLFHSGERLASHVADHAQIILDLALRRAALKAIEEGRAHILGDFASPASDLVSQIEQTLANFSLAASEEEDIDLRAAARSALTKYNQGGRGLCTGLETLDAMIGGLFPEDLVIIAGRPSMGKTAVADVISDAVARQRDPVTGARRVVAHWSGEMAAEQLAERALSRASHDQQRPFEYRAFRRRSLPESGVGALVEALPDTLVINKRGGITLERLRAFLRRTRRAKKRLDLVVVDYLQLMRDDARRHGETAEVTALTAGLKSMAKEFEVPFVVLSQLSRQLESRDDKRPQLSDLRQSGSIEQDADTVIFVYRESYYLERDEPRQRTGESGVEWDQRYFRWMDSKQAARGRIELITGKARHDAIMAQGLRVELGFDLVADAPVNERAIARRAV